MEMDVARLDLLAFCVESFPALTHLMYRTCVLLSVGRNRPSACNYIQHANKKETTPLTVVIFNLEILITLYCCVLHLDSERLINYSAAVYSSSV